MSNIVRELIFKEDRQEYAQVQRLLGNSRCEVMGMDGVKRSCYIAGQGRTKKGLIAVGDIILIGLRDYQDSKGDIIAKYFADEVRLLKAYGELPANTELPPENTGLGGGMNEEGGAGNGN